MTRLLQACYGHTEGAAGLAGALTAAALCSSAAAPPTASLRGLNPFVAAATADWRARQGMPAALPRCEMPAPALVRRCPCVAPPRISCNGHVMRRYITPLPVTLSVYAGPHMRIGLHQLFRYEWRQCTCAHRWLHCSTAEANWPGKGWRACMVCFLAALQVPRMSYSYGSTRTCIASPQSPPIEHTRPLTGISSRYYAGSGSSC
jgi:hypothetical protein